MTHFLKYQDLYWLIIVSIILWYAALKIESGLLAIHDPIAWLYQVSGWTSMIALILGFCLPRPYAKYMGYFAFTLSMLHVGIFIYFDFNFFWEAILDEIIHKHYLYYGLIAWLIFCLNIILSFKNLFWKLKLIYSVYLIVFLGEIHIVMIQKVMTPLYMTCIALFLFLTIWHMIGTIKKHISKT